MAKGKRTIVSWLAGLLLAGLLSVPLLVGGPANPHYYQVACDECHLRAPQKGEAATRMFVADIESLCLRCHVEIRLSMSHPVGVKPSFSLPADMFLDWKGELTCSTCHLMHPDENRDFAGGRALLRRNSRGRAFCLECHRQDFLSNRSMGHSMAGSGAHYTPMAGEAGTGSRLGQSSAACLTCHDGSLGRDEGVPEGPGIWRHGGYGERTSHPLGVSYRDAQQRHRHGYREMASLPEVIRLPDGKVECVSCHNLYSHNRHLLAISNERSRLCLTCHRK